MNITKEQRFGIISSIIFLLTFTGLLFLFGFSFEIPHEEEGILINFGTTDFGSGAVEPRPTPEPTPQESVPEPVATPPTPTQSETNEEEVLSQNYDQTAAIEQQKRKEKERKQEAERIKKEQEAEKKRLEELEKQRIAEQKRLQEEAEKKEIETLTKNAFGGQNPNGDDTGEGVTGKPGNQGSPDGDINSQNRIGGSGGGNGISFNLTGRNPKALPKPVYTAQAEGKVVVEVKVDQNGNVISARAGVKGTTTSDKQLHQSAYNAAMKARFDINKDAPAQQIGTITYHFMLQ